VFVLNFNPQVVHVDLGGEEFSEIKSGAVLKGNVEIGSFGYLILEKLPGSAPVTL